MAYGIAPVNIFILLRGVLDEDQWVVPYAGGGFTRLYYKEKIESQGTVNGSVDGYHVRGGLQFLLDAWTRELRTECTRTMASTTRIFLQRPSILTRL